VDLAAELQKIYDSEINLRISWLWDGGIDVRLGDGTNGYLAEERAVRKRDHTVAPGDHRALSRLQLRSFARSRTEASRRKSGCFGRR
jgi:hypothetical protein